MDSTIDAQTRTPRVSDRGFFVLNAVVSTCALAFLTWLLLFGGEARIADVDFGFMPALNASLNALAATLLCAGWWAIRRGRPQLHKWLMVASFASSTLFLVGYVVYHYAVGDTKYEGSLGWIYFPILISHILLSIPIVPMALSAFYFAWRQRFATHKRITRWLAPMWIYVSVTGVLVFLLLR